MSGSGPDGAAVRVEQFRPAQLPTSRQTLYLLSKDGGGSAAPRVAALTDRAMRAATLAAERAGGRLDPPMVVVLDEAANICRIADLPQLYSHLGSRGAAASYGTVGSRRSVPGAGARAPDAQQVDRFLECLVVPAVPQHRLPRSDVLITCVVVACPRGSRPALRRPGRLRKWRSRKGCERA